jgi:ferrous iron transport protein B
VGAQESSLYYSYAGKIGRSLEPLVRPIGFNWKIAVSLIPSFAAREVMISSLATVYAVGAQKDDGFESALGKHLLQDWSLATALSLLVWYVLACQCLSTLAVARRETNSWRWPAFQFAYMSLLAYAASLLIAQGGRFLGWH